MSVGPPLPRELFFVALCRTDRLSASFYLGERRLCVFHMEIFRRVGWHKWKLQWDPTSFHLKKNSAQKVISKFLPPPSCRITRGCETSRWSVWWSLCLIWFGSGAICFLYKNNHLMWLLLRITGFSDHNTNFLYCGSHQNSDYVTGRSCEHRLVRHFSLISAVSHYRIITVLSYSLKINITSSLNFMSPPLCRYNERILAPRNRGTA